MSKANICPLAFAVLVSSSHKKYFLKNLFEDVMEEFIEVFVEGPSSIILRKGSDRDIKF